MRLRGGIRGWYSTQAQLSDASAAYVLTPYQIAAFHTDGFLTLNDITTAAEVASLRRILEDLRRRRAGYDEGAQFDLTGEANGLSEKTVIQIMNPANYAPRLRATQFRRNAESIAKQLLGDSSAFFEHAIVKPPGSDVATPWHQDEAYRSEGDLVYRELSFWLPLQPVTVESGCMQFLPGSQLGPLHDHRPIGGVSTVHALECIPTPDDAAAIVCPLPVGGCTVHHGRTLHYTGPNRSTFSRWAYVLCFDVPLKPRRHARAFPWNASRQTKDGARRLRWLRSGGFVIQAWRSLKAVARAPSRLPVALMRACRIAANLIGRPHGSNTITPRIAAEPARALARESRGIVGDSPTTGVSG